MQVYSQQFKLGVQIRHFTHLCVGFNLACMNYEFAVLFHCSMNKQRPWPIHKDIHLTFAFFSDFSCASLCARRALYSANCSGVMDDVSTSSSVDLFFLFDESLTDCDDALRIFQPVLNMATQKKINCFMCFKTNAKMHLMCLLFLKPTFLVFLKNVLSQNVIEKR